MFKNTYPTTREFKLRRLRALARTLFWIAYAILSLAVFAALVWLALAIPDV